MSTTVLDVAEVLGITGLSSEPHHLAEETQKGKDLSEITIDLCVYSGALSMCDNDTVPTTL